MSLARITSAATKRDVLAGDDSGVVDDVFPSRRCLSRAATRHFLKHLDATIYALLVSGPNLIFKRLRNVPDIHGAIQRPTRKR